MAVNTSRAPDQALRSDYLRNPLLRLGAITIKSEADAFQYCERRFRKVHDFSFVRPDGNILSSAGTMLAGCRIATVSSTGHRIAMGEDDNFTLLVPLHGTLTVQCGKVERSARPGDILAVGSSARTTVLSEDYLGALISVPTGQLGSDLQLYGLHSDTEGILCTPVGDEFGHGETLRSYAEHLVNELASRDTLLASPRAAAFAIALLRDFIVQWHISTRQAGPGDGRWQLAVPRFLVRAEEFIRANSHDQMSVADIAAAASTGIRTLQLAFKKHRGVTPHTFVHRCRIERARERLLSAGPSETVTSIAVDCGIAHLGRFASAYSGLFGEPPSATLKSARN